MLAEGLSRDPANVERFLRQAQAASAIHHPNVANVTDFGTEPAFVVMEQLCGEPLSDRMRREAPMAWPTAQQIIVQVVRGLKAAHERGVAHRDVRPGNIFLAHCADGITRVKLLDFGVATLARGDRRYASPEQLDGDEGDTRSDIYAVGVVLHEMLTGCAPLDSDDVLSVSDFVDDLLRRALARDPDARYASMAELEAAILSAGIDATTMTANPLRDEDPDFDLDRTTIWSPAHRLALADTVLSSRPEPAMPPVSLHAPPQLPRASRPAPAMPPVSLRPCPAPAPPPMRPPTPMPRPVPLTYLGTNPPTFPPTPPPSLPPQPAAELVLTVPPRFQSRDLLAILVATITAVCLAGGAAILV